jgi:predicted nuclease of predicted toxin-antitoxin system
MRFLIDENVSRTVIRELRKAGQDVLSVKESMRAAKDEDLIARARLEDRILVTHDKDFGELAFRLGVTSSSGVVLIRLAGRSPDEDNFRILKVLLSRIDFTGNFTVITEDKIRVRPLPPP